MRSRSLFWWLFAVSFTLAGTGLIGLITTMLIFPKVNLLGYIFGAFWLVGAPLLLGVSVAWSVVRVRGIMHNRAKGARAQQEGNGPPLLRAAAGVLAVLFGGCLLLGLGGVQVWGRNALWSALWAATLMLAFGSYSLRGRKARLPVFLGLGSGPPPSGASHHTATVNDPLVIQGPRIGFLNLLGADGEGLLRQDWEVLRAIFASAEHGKDAVPDCDILIVYCQIQGSGDVRGHRGGLRSIATEAGATIIVVAAENEGNAYVAAMGAAGAVQANFILTVKRKGQCFAQFLLRLFQKMFEDKPMPVAWGELAPQIPGDLHEDCPETVALMWAGGVVFQRLPALSSAQ
jgi:hypothetical protein